MTLIGDRNSRSAHLLVEGEEDWKRPATRPGGGGVEPAYIPLHRLSSQRTSATEKSASVRRLSWHPRILCVVSVAGTHR